MGVGDGGWGGGNESTIEGKEKKTVELISPSGIQEEHDHLSSQLESVRRPTHLIWNHLWWFSHWTTICVWHQTCAISIHFLSADFLWYRALFIKNRKRGKFLFSKAFHKVTSHLQLIKLQTWYIVSHCCMKCKFKYTTVTTFLLLGIRKFHN